MPAKPDPQLDISLRIEDETWFEQGDINQLEDLATRALQQAAKHSRAGQLDLLLTDNEAMQALNKHWRAKDKPTDVLSFPSDDDSFAHGFLGDISLGYGIVMGDCTRMNRGFSAHFSHLLIHGYLHLLGFDHETDEDAQEMESLETKILAELGYSDPYCLNTES